MVLSTVSAIVVSSVSLPCAAPAAPATSSPATKAIARLVVSGPACLGKRRRPMRGMTPITRPIAVQIGRRAHRAVGRRQADQQQGAHQQADGDGRNREDEEAALFALCSRRVDRRVDHLERRIGAVERGRRVEPGLFEQGHGYARRRGRRLQALHELAELRIERRGRAGWRGRWRRSVGRPERGADSTPGSVGRRPEPLVRSSSAALSCPS